MGKSGSKVRNNREFFVGDKKHEQLLNQNKNFCSNKISTTKYTFYSFVPKFLLEQFRKAANCFFLLVSLLQIIPGVSPTGRFTTLTPLSIILALTALKEIFEDIRRWKQDKNVNERKVRVLAKVEDAETGSVSYRWDITNWDELKVGNIVHLSSNQTIITSSNSKLTPDVPSDLLILATR